MIGISAKGDFGKTRSFIARKRKGVIFQDLNKYGEMGVAALSQSTPIDSRLTANSWKYRIVQDRKGPRLEWYNTNDAGGASVAVLIQYGHGTGTGGYVVGRDFINPAMRPTFDRIASEFGRKVRS